TARPSTPTMRTARPECVPSPTRWEHSPPEPERGWRCRPGLQSPGHRSNPARTYVRHHGCRGRSPRLLFEHTFESREVGMAPLPGLPVQYGRGNAATVGYLASAAEPTGGVVVAHDRYGALPHLRARCE